MSNAFVTIDLGSSQASFCLFSNQIGIEKRTLNSNEWEKVKGLTGILSSVRSEKTLLDKHPYLNDDNIFRIGSYFRENNFLDMPVNYQQTLGQDRLACAYWAWKNESLKPGKAAYIIDAGTFLTIDRVSEKGFEGGFIFPGIQILLNSYKVAENLPLLNDISWNANPKELPSSTKKAMMNAIEVMYLTSLSKIIQEPCSIYLTGGEAQTFAKLFINKKLEFQLSPYLIHLGLAQCLNTIQEGL